MQMVSHCLKANTVAGGMQHGGHTEQGTVAMQRLENPGTDAAAPGQRPHVDLHFWRRVLA